MKQTRKPTHPGAVLCELYLDEIGISITAFAEDIGVSRKAISAIANGHKSVTPEMALRFAKALNTTPELWLNLQQNFDLWVARNSIKDEISEIHPVFATA